jgi:diguanylate cyclase (GGDEF)-like protein
MGQDGPPDEDDAEELVADKAIAETGTGALGVLSVGAAALARAGDMDTALAVVVEAGAAACGALTAAVFAQDPDRNNLELLLTLGIADGDAEAFEREVVGDLDHPLQHAAQDRTGTLGRTGRAADGKVTTSADLPLVVAGGGGGVEVCVGVLTLGWAGDHVVDTAEETLLVAVADLVAASIVAFRTSSMATERGEWLERMALTDPLTGLANARTVARVLDLEVARAQRQGTEVSVALFDVDGFRELNAASGSRAGDLVLRQVASVLASSVRLVDTIARTGGDEFVLVAPGSAGTTVARRVMEGIAGLDAVGDHTISISAAVARFPGDGADAESLLQAARAALAASTATSAIVEADGSTSGA